MDSIPRCAPAPANPKVVQGLQGAEPSPQRQQPAAHRRGLPTAAPRCNSWCAPVKCTTVHSRLHHVKAWPAHCSEMHQLMGAGSKRIAICGCIPGLAMHQVPEGGRPQLPQAMVPRIHRHRSLPPKTTHSSGSGSRRSSRHSPGHPQRQGSALGATSQSRTSSLRQKPTSQPRRRQRQRGAPPAAPQQIRSAKWGCGSTNPQRGSGRGTWSLQRFMGISRNRSVAEPRRLQRRARRCQQPPTPRPHRLRPVPFRRHPQRLTCPQPASRTSGGCRRCRARWPGFWRRLCWLTFAPASMRPSNPRSRSDAGCSCECSQCIRRIHPGTTCRSSCCLFWCDWPRIPPCWDIRLDIGVVGSDTDCKVCEEGQVLHCAGRGRPKSRWMQRRTQQPAPPLSCRLLAGGGEGGRGGRPPSRTSTVWPQPHGGGRLPWMACPSLSGRWAC